MTGRKLFVFVLILIGFTVACAEEDSTLPRVVSTFPLNMSQDIDPSIKDISVTFNEEMMDVNWSWAYEDKSQFPQMTGQA